MNSAKKATRQPKAADKQTATPRQPKVGDVVHYIEGDFETSAHGGSHAEGADHSGTNGTRVHPAIVTRVWSDHCVNLHVLFDAHGAEPRCSVTMHETPADTHNPNAGWRWP